ncbi:MAG: hypothetical protein H7836_07985 [Magnetococcus sp. YQC-3]
MRGRIGPLRVDKKARALLTFLLSEPIELEDCLSVVNQMEVIIKAHPLYKKNQKCELCGDTGITSNGVCVCVEKEIS